MDLANVTGESDPKIFFKFFGLFAFVLVMSLMIAGLHSQMGSRFAEIFLWLIILGMSVYFVLLYYKTVPRIYLDTELLQYNNKKYYWVDLETIAFTGKWPVLFESNQEGLMLKFHGGKDLYIFDDTFSNIGDIKRFIKENVIEKTPEAIRPIVVEAEGQMDKIIRNPSSENMAVPLIIRKETVINENTGLSEETFTTYSNSQFFGQRGYLIWLLPIMSSFSLLRTANLTGAIILISICLLWITGWSRTVYYFKLSNESLVVRNHNLFWLKYTYPLSEIKEITFEQKYSKSPNTLRITTNSFKSDRFQAGTLWTKTWFTLKDDLEQKGIKVRNDCVMNIWQP